MSDAEESPSNNPFPGLRPFREDEEHLFFGRENQIDAMVDKLAATRFLAVVGTSGSGKSSLVNCGLRPALRQGLMAAAGTAWRMAQFRPGNDPIGAMARALAQAGVLFPEQAGADMALAEIIETTLRMSKLGLIDIREQAALDEGVNLLLVADQFEELFRYRQVGNPDNRDAEKMADATAFVNLLLEARQRPDLRIFVVLTMRSDFLGDCTKYPGLAEAINAGQYLVPRMTRDERRAAIEGPIHVGGAQAAPVLLTRLVNDVGDKPDQLSILQHALNRTWACWRGEGGKGPLQLSHYEAIGTMSGALDRHAERAYGELGSARQQEVCERLFKALTDMANDPRGVRRPTTLASLCALADATSSEVTAVIDVFRKPSRSFLMPPAGDELGPDTVIDISHESLMRVWERLIKWADEEAQSARAYRRLAEAAQLHAEGKANLWRDPELGLALAWRDKTQPNETWASRYHSGFAEAMAFLTASSEARDAERAERESQHQRERDAEREKIEAQERNARRLFRAAMATGVVAVVALILGGFAAYYFWQANELSTIAAASEAKAREYLVRAQITESRSLAKAAEQDPVDPSVEILLALEALPDTKEGVQRPFVLEAQKILAKGVNSLLELAVIGGHSGSPQAVAVMPGGKQILTGSNDNIARIWDAVSGAEVLQFKGHDKPIAAVAVMPDGRRIVTGSGDNTARVWDAITADPRFKLDCTSPVLSVAVTPDGTRIITGSDDGKVRVWDASSGLQLMELAGHSGAVRSIVVTADGTRIITGSADSTARVWDAVTGKEVHVLKSDHSVRSVAVTRDGTRIMTGLSDNTARIWSAVTGLELRQLQGHTGAVTAVAAGPDGLIVATGSDDGSVRLWNGLAGEELARLNGHTSPISAVDFTPDGTRIVTASSDKTIRIWDARTGAPQLWLTGHSGSVMGVTVTPDGSRIVTAGDATSRVREAGSGADVAVFKGHTSTLLAVASMPDGREIVTSSADNTVRIWDAATGIERLQLAVRAVRSVAVTPDGTGVITASSDNIVRVWDASNGKLRLELKGHTGTVRSLAVMPDGSRIVSGSDDGTARVWNASTGVELQQLKHARQVLSVAVTRDNARIVTGSADGTARIWDAGSWFELMQFKGHTRAVRTVAVTPNGTRIVTGSDDGTIRVWDAITGVEMLEKSTARPLSLTVTPDGTRIVASAENSVSVWAFAQLRPAPRPVEPDGPLARQALVDYAKSVVPHCLTIEQRVTFQLRPHPPGWCIDMKKYPYDAPYWKAWRDGNTAAALDTETARTFGNFSDALIRAGDFRSALEAAELGIAFDPKQVWIMMNKAHAHMFLEETNEALRVYRDHRGEKIEQGPWEEVVVNDFQRLRDEVGLDNPLMVVVEREFKPALPNDPPK